jgi:RNA-directed DNA polymerase
MESKESAEGIVPCEVLYEERPELTKSRDHCYESYRIRSCRQVIRNPAGSISHDKPGESETVASLPVEQQSSMAINNRCGLAQELMEKVCERSNLNRAYKRVRSNKGAPGIDGMTIDSLGIYIKDHKEDLITSLLEGSFKPSPVRSVMIPKAGGGERQLGIPTVVDRLVQQAILQALEPIFDPGFSESSYGFRPGRNAHQAIKKAQSHVEEGYEWVVDIDLEKFFDTVNHDILISRLSRKIDDKRLLKIIGRFLRSGLMQGGLVTTRQEGTPQGGPLSPLLSNILLDEVDKELENRGHKFCRYADDMNIYVQSERAGERVSSSITDFLEKRLKLKVNREKSQVARVHEVKFLGYRILIGGGISIAQETISRAKDKIRELTKRNQGKSIKEVISRLNIYLQGWVNYYRLNQYKSHFKDLDCWIRRRLRCYKLKQKKRGSIVPMLIFMGIPELEARQIGSSGKGFWRLSITPALHRALDIAWFKLQGLINLSDKMASRR